VDRRSHRRGVPHKTNLADSADSARNVNDPLTVRLVCTKIPYQSIYGTWYFWISPEILLFSAAESELELNIFVCACSEEYSPFGVTDGTCDRGK
jgi:hypothetical protein